ncbi:MULTISPECIES: hypothetical protein [Saccharothrix]|uniref:hypothetical protein n=1 Tax=Saccharothrix TaxID=2071 RepID=UPI0011613209|nr:hypothetical protein [Saccharothrix sp. CB00851]
MYSFLPSSRRGWGWFLIIVGTCLAAMMWLGVPPPASAGAIGAVGGLTGSLFGIAAVADRRHGVWWAWCGVLVFAAGIGLFAYLRP